MRVRRLLPIAVLALLLAACGDERGVRIVALTSTPTPSAQTAGTATPDRSATPPPVDLPARPENPFAGGAAVSEYIAGGRANIADCLPELERAWSLAPVSGPRCVAADIDGDGGDELVLLITIGDEPEPAGEAWFFDDEEAGYRFFSSARALANDVLTGLAIAGVHDLTGDGRPEVTLSARTCDDRECTTQIVIAGQHRGVLEDLAPDDSALAEVDEVVIEDDDGDGLPDILMRRDATAAPGPGPQRGLTRRIAWSGVRFAVIDQEDAPEFLIHLVNDADAAYRLGEFAEARRLYEAAADDTGLRDWKREAGEFIGRRELVPYALFRAALAAGRQGDNAAAESLLTRAAGDTNSMHGIAAALYLGALQSGQPASVGCAEAQRYLQQFAQAYQRFWDYGYANPERTLANLCP